METKEYTFYVTYKESIVSFKAIGTLPQAVEFAEALDGEVIEIVNEEHKTIVTIDRR